MSYISVFPKLFITVCCKSYETVTRVSIMHTCLLIQVESLQAYEGEVDKLGNAEKFFHGLIHLTDFKLRIEMMLLRGDFNSQIGSVRPNIQVLNTVCRKLMDNQSLKVFLRFVLHAGNFVNKVQCLYPTYLMHI